MEVQLSADQKAFAERAVEMGRLRDENDAVHEALALWEERERERLELVAGLERARNSVQAGRGRIVTEESMRTLAADVKARGRARLLAELSSAD